MVNAVATKTSSLQFIFSDCSLSYTAVPLATSSAAPSSVARRRRTSPAWTSWSPGTSSPSSWVRRCWTPSLPSGQFSEIVWDGMGRDWDGKNGDCLSMLYFACMDYERVENKQQTKITHFKSTSIEKQLTVWQFLNRQEQAGAELCQAQVKLGLAKLPLSSNFF